MKTRTQKARSIWDYCGFSTKVVLAESSPLKLYNQTISVSTTGGDLKTQLVGFSIGAGYAW